MQILVVANDQPRVSSFFEALHSADLQTCVVGPGFLPASVAAMRRVRALIIDSAPAHAAGVALCARIRSEFGLDTPVIMLGDADSIDDKLAAFAAGCDDYLVRPFHAQELLARLRAIWRRQSPQVGVDTLLRVADLEHDQGTCETRRAGRGIRLGPISRKLLRLLLHESPRVVTRERLEFEIWGDSVPERDLLRSHISMLRRAIDAPPAAKLLQTVYGTGFRLIG